MAIRRKRNEAPGRGIASGPPGPRGEPRSLAFGAAVLGILSVAGAIIIGSVGDHASMKATEQRYQDFYLEKTHLLAELVERNKGISTEETLAMIDAAWQVASDGPADEHVCIVDNRSRLILHTAHPETVGNYAGDDRLPGSDARPPRRMRDLVDSGDEYVGGYISSAGQEQIAAFHYIPGRQWTLGVHRSKAALSEEIRSGTRYLTVGFLAVCGLLLPFSLLLLYRMHCGSLEALRASEERFRAIAQDTPFLICRFLPGGEITYVNDLYCRYFQKTYEELVGHTFLSLIPEADRETVMANIAAMTVESPNQSHEHRAIAPGGEIRWQRWTNRILFDDTGRIVGHQAVGEDITERKRAEEELRRYEHIVSRASDMLALLDRNYVYLAANAAYLQAFAKTTDEVIGRTVAEVCGQEFFSTVIEPRAKRCLTGEDIRYNAWFDFPSAGRKYMDVAYRPYLGPDGQVTGFVVAARDITERKRTEEALRKEHDFVESLVETAQAIVLVLDPQARIVRFNAYMTEVSGYRLEEVQGKDWFTTFLPKRDHTAIRELFSRAVGDIQTRGNVNSIVAKDGRELEIEWYDKTLKDADDNVVGVLAIGQDVTERRRVEDALRGTTARLHLALRSSNIGPWDWDLRTDKVYFSPEWKQQIGYADHEIESCYEEWESRLHPEDRDKTLASLKEYLDGECEEYAVEFRLRHKDGSYRWIFTRGDVVRDQDGKPTRILGCHVDITERRQLAQAYEALFREMLDGFALHEMIYDEQGKPTDYRFLGVNPAFERLTGLKAQDVVGKTVLEVLPGIEPHWIETYGKVALTGEPAFFDNYAGELGKHFEVAAYCPAPNQFACIFVDITERKRAEEALKESEERLRAVLDNSTTVLYLKDTEGRYILVNRQYETLFHVTEAEVVGKTDYDLFPEEAADALVANDRAVLAADAPLEFEEDVPHDDGLHTYVSVKFPLPDATGTTYAVCGISTDITERKKAAEELKVWKAGVESADEGIAFTQMNGDVLFFNDAACRLFGFTPAEMSTLNTSKFSATAAESQRLEDSVRRTGGFSGEVLGVRKNGEVFPAMLSVSVVKDEKGEAIGRMGVFADITERKRAEEALVYRLRFENLVSLISLRFVSLPPEETDGGIEEALEELAQFVDCDAGFVCRFSDDGREFSLTHLWQDERYLTARKEDMQDVDVASMPWLMGELASAESVPVVSVAALPTEAAVERDRLKDYGVKSMIDMPMTYQGELVGFLGVKCARHEREWTEDETALLKMVGQVFTGALQRKRAEDALRQSEKKHRSLTENLPQRIFHKDANLVYVSCNERYAQDLGIAADEIAGKTDFDFHPKELADKYRADDRRLMESGRTEEIEESYVRDGQHLFIHTVKTPLTDSAGNVAGALGIFWDITERRELEEQLRQAHKMEAIGTLAGGIAHDFNNILAAIIGYADILLGQIASDRPPKWEHLQKILSAGERAKELVQHILAFSRQSESCKAPVQLSEIVDEVLRLIRAALPSTIEIQKTMAHGSATVMGDSTEIHQVVMNLCTNAWQAMGDEGGVLKVKQELAALDKESAELRDDLTPGPYVKLSISDTGCGMSEEVCSRAFDPFFTTKDTGGGTGMGLAVVHGIVKSHGGDITVRSEIGEGSVFEVLLPRCEDDAVSTDDANDATTLPRGNERILLVDDEDDILEVGRRILGPLGYEVVVARNGVEALDAFVARADDFDLVVTDLTMPKMTGPELARKIFEIRRDIPVLLCTGHMTAATGRTAREIGICAIVMKPLGRRELAEAVRQALESHGTLNEYP